MIIPIVKSVKGEDQTIGTASVISEGDDVSVEFFLRAGFSITEKVKADLTKQFKRFVR
jgi:hypothetical protein